MCEHVYEPVITAQCGKAVVEMDPGEGAEKCLLVSETGSMAESMGGAMSLWKVKRKDAEAWNYS